MFQLARQNQRRADIATRAPAVEYMPAHTVGKQAFTDNLHAKNLGEPDFYQRAVDSALRELDAVRHTALPNYVAIRRKQDLAPLAKQIELAKAAMQVRYMIESANKHVFLLEAAETYKNPMVAFLRAHLDRAVARATKLGVYDGAMDMRPRRYVDDSALKVNSCTIAVTLNRNGSTNDTKVATTVPSLASPKPAANPKAGNTPRRIPRVARGTGAPAPARTVATHAQGEPTDTSRARVRPGFRASR